MKNFFKVFEIIAIVAIIGIGLAGCVQRYESLSDIEPGPTPSGTIKLTGTGVNTFTLTLTGMTWLDSAAGTFSGDDYYYSPGGSSGRYGLLVFDGLVTADGADDNNPAINAPHILVYTGVRTSDTVLTVTISKRTEFWTQFWGSGKIKIYSDFDRYDFYRYFIKEFAGGEVEDNMLTVAADSGSASFNIPKD